MFMGVAVSCRDNIKCKWLGMFHIGSLMQVELIQQLQLHCDAFLLISNKVSAEIRNRYN